MDGGLPPPSYRACWAHNEAGYSRPALCPRRLAIASPPTRFGRGGSTGWSALDAAGRLINTELAERRNLALINAAGGNGYATTKTLVAAYQMIMPGEKARTYRHTPNALRLILDVQLVQLLEPMFFESYPGHYQEADASCESSPMRFAWAETRRPLDAAPSGTEIALGDPALDTMAISMIGLCAGDATPNRRMTANNLYAVVAGTGTTNVDGERFAWQLGDVIAVPAWQPHIHTRRWKTPCCSGSVMNR